MRTPRAPLQVVACAFSGSAFIRPQKVPNFTILTRPSRVVRRVFRARSPREFLAHVSFAPARASHRRVARQSFGTDRDPQTSRFSETSSRSSRVAAARSRRDSRRTRVAHVSCSRSTITSSVEARGDAREALQSAA